MSEFTENKGGILFYPTTDIPDTHWAINCEKEYKVGVFGVDGVEVLVKINPSDCRGYRMIAQLYSSDDMKKTLNREWTVTEMNAVLKMGAILSKFYFEIGLFPQIYFAGNNSMEAINYIENTTILLGKKEPSMMHIHVLGRGITGNEYVKGVTYIGPKIGLEFNLKGDGLLQDGMKKMPWDDDARMVLKTKVFGFLKKMKEQNVF